MPTKRSSAEIVVALGSLGVDNVQGSAGDSAGLVIIFGVLLVSLGLLAVTRLIRPLVGRLRDFWGTEC